MIFSTTFKSHAFKEKFKMFLNIRNHNVFAPAADVGEDFQGCAFCAVIFFYFCEL